MEFLFLLVIVFFGAFDSSVIVLKNYSVVVKFALLVPVLVPATLYFKDNKFPLEKSANLADLLGVLGSSNSVEKGFWGNYFLLRPNQDF